MSKESINNHEFNTPLDKYIDTIGNGLAHIQLCLMGLEKNKFSYDEIQKVWSDLSTKLNLTKAAFMVNEESGTHADKIKKIDIMIEFVMDLLNQDKADPTARILADEKNIEDIINIYKN